MVSKNTLSSKEKEELLYEQSLSLVDDIAKLREYPDWFNAKNPLIVKELKELISQDLVPSLSTDKRYEVSVKALSGYYAEEAMARAALQPSVPSVKSSISLPLTESGTVTNSGSSLKIDAKKSQVSADIGFVGSGNGRLEKGEKGMISLYIKNTSSKRLYSTSLYITDIGDCLFSPKLSSEEILLPEFSPDRYVNINIEVYVSKDCTNGDYSIKLKAYDSVYFASSPQYFSVNLRPQSVGGGAQLSRVRLDGDEYGYSEVTNLKPLMPETKFELSAGLKTRLPKINEVSQYFHLPAGMNGDYTVFPQKVTYSNGVGRALPVDDVDIVVSSQSLLDNSLTVPALHFGWEKSEDAKVYVAVDSYLSQPIEGTKRVKKEIDTDAFDKALGKYTIVDVLTSKSSTAVVTEVDGLKPRVTDYSALLSALEGTVKERAIETEAKRTFAFRHYIELPISWKPVTVLPVCRLRASSLSVNKGDAVTLHGSVENLPPDSVVTLKKDERVIESFISEQLKTTETVSTFMTSVNMGSSGSQRYQLQVAKGADVLCRTSQTITVKKPEKIQVEQEEKRVPKLVSLEYGNNFGPTGAKRISLSDDSVYSLYGPVIRMSIGRSVRLQLGTQRYTFEDSGLTYTTSKGAVMVGARFTQVLNQNSGNDKFYVELSENLSITRFAVNMLDSELLVSPSVMLSVHRVFGGYIEFAPINFYQGQAVGASLNLGAGLYF